MKKLALLFGFSVLVMACHTKEPQNQSGINDPTNYVYGDVDSSVLNKSVPDSANKPAPAPAEASAAESAKSCIDSSKINKEAMCTQEYKPVCGCDGKTYSNICTAEKEGLTQWTDGECPGDKKGEGANKKEEAKPADKKAAAKSSGKETGKSDKKAAGKEKDSGKKKKK